MSEVSRTVMKLALRLAERGDAEGAAEALRGVLAMLDRDEGPAPPAELRAVKKATLARLLECSTRHIDKIEKKFPPGSVLGEGSAKRYVVSIVFAALGKVAPVMADPIADEARAYARRRSRLKAVAGGST